jgi:branched-chain amino acid transport system ATP-binding protein
MIKLENVSKYYKTFPAVLDVSLEIGRGEVFGFIGPNGAGKTTTLRAISGLSPLRGGRIEFAGERVDGLASPQVVARGIAHVPEARQLFPTMSVKENLEVGARSREARRARAETMAWVFELFPRLSERQGQLAGTLSGGEQQMCAIGRALMAKPRLLMLDEPSLGLAPVVVRSIFDDLRRINAGGLTILLVEQNVLRSLGLCHRGYVLENGRITLAGGRESLLADPHIKQAYLGL